jgi:hypothetical protein
LNRKLKIKGLSKWEDFRIRRDQAIAKYCAASEKMKGSNAWVKFIMFHYRIRKLKANQMVIKKIRLAQYDKVWKLVFI